MGYYPTAHQHEASWLDKYERALQDQDLDSMLKLLQGAPSLIGATDEYAQAFVGHRKNYFDTYVAPQYQQKDRDNAYLAFTKNISLPNTHADTVKAAAAANPMPKTTADEVRANSKKEIKPTVTPTNQSQQPQIQPEKSIADRLRDSIHASGMRTAEESSAEERAFADRMYKESTGFDITTPEGRYKSKLAAIERMNRGRSTGVATFTDPSGKNWNYSTDPDAHAVWYDSEGKAHHELTNREKAYEKTFGENGTWVGQNPFDKRFKDPSGNVWDSEDAFRQSGMANYDMMGRGPNDIKTPEDLPESVFSHQQRSDIAFRQIQDANTARQTVETAKSDWFDNPNRHRNYYVARVRANARGDTSLDNIAPEAYDSPDFVHWTKGNQPLPNKQLAVPRPLAARDPSAGYGPIPYNVTNMGGPATSQSRLTLPPMPNTQIPWNENYGGYVNGKWMSPSDGFNYPFKQ